MPRWMAVALFHALSSGTAMAQCEGKLADLSRESYEAGANHYRAHRYFEAIGEFEKAYTLCPDTEFLFNLGQAHRRLDQRQNALAYYYQYVERDRRGRMRGKAKRFIELIQQDLRRHAPGGVQSSPASRSGAQPADDELLSPTATPPPMGNAAAASPLVPPQGSPALPAADRALIVVPSTIDALPTRVSEPMPKGTEDRRPWRKWWLWTSVGGGLLLGAGAVTAVALSPRFEPPIEGSLGGWGGP